MRASIYAPRFNRKPRPRRRKRLGAIWVGASPAIRKLMEKKAAPSLGWSFLSMLRLWPQCRNATRNSYREYSS
jgi:hypothetical protein